MNAAMGSLFRAVDLNPDAAFAHYLLGLAYYKIAMYKDAEASLLRALELEDRLSIARLVLAEVHIRLHESPNALKQLRLYVDENPDASNAALVQHIISRLEAAIEAGKKSQNQARFVGINHDDQERGNR